MPSVAELIKQAEEFVDQAELADADLREVAFSETLRHLFGQSPIDGSRVPPHRALVPTTANDGGSDSSRADVNTVAEAMNLPPETVSSVLTIDDEAVSVEMPTDRLPTAKADAAREVAIVLAAVHKVLGRDAPTSTVRAILRDYGRFDSANFMSSVKKIPREWLAVKGRPGTKEQHLTRIHRSKLEGAGCRAGGEFGGRAGVRRAVPERGAVAQRRSARLGGAEGAGARVREACAGMLARASDPCWRCERASGRER